MTELEQKDVAIILNHLLLKVRGSFTELDNDSGGMEECINSVNNLFGTDIRTYDDFHSFSEMVFNDWASKGKNIFFNTSGSTGIPKKCMITKDCYEEECEYLKELFKNCKRIISFAPSYHLYGFTHGVVLPKVLGVEALYFSPLPTAEALGQINDGDAVIGFPVFWAAFAAINNQKRKIIGVSSTAPIGNDLFKNLLENHTEKMIEIYGASELGVIGYRLNPDDCFTLFQRPSLGNIEDIMPDKAEWVENGKFILKGRTDNAVQVGGINVYPEKINSIILESEIIEKSAVRLMKTSEGNRLKAFIVLKNKNINKIEALTHLKKHLESHNLTSSETIRSFTFGDRLPTNELGKIIDWNI